MARKRTPEAEPPPYAEVVVYRPNGVEFSRVPTDARSARAVVGAAWATITTQHGWTPDIRVIRTWDHADITNLI